MDTFQQTCNARQVSWGGAQVTVNIQSDITNWAFFIQTVTLMKISLGGAQLTININELNTVWVCINTGFVMRGS